MTKTLAEMTIKTPLEDLFYLIKTEGLSKDIEDTNKIADIIGNHSYAEIAKICEEQEQLVLFTLTKLWAAKDVINFYNKYVDEPVFKTFERDNYELRDKVVEYGNAAEAYKVLYSNTCEELEKSLAAYHDKAEEAEGLKLEVVKLKAKLYDLMVK